ALERRHPVPSCLRKRLWGAPGTIERRASYGGGGRCPMAVSGLGAGSGGDGTMPAKQTGMFRLRLMLHPFREINTDKRRNVGKREAVDGDEIPTGKAGIEHVEETRQADGAALGEGRNLLEIDRPRQGAANHAF